MRHYRHHALIRATSTLSILILAIFPSAPCAAFSPPVITHSIKSRHAIIQRNRSTAFSESSDKDTTLSEKESSNDKNEVIQSKNPLEIASWYAVEAFGKAFGSLGKSFQEETSSAAAAGGGNDSMDEFKIDFTKNPSSLKETLKRIELDNDRSYFLSGEVDKFIYDEDCIFADPFVSFKGRERFIENLSNLGSFITNYDAKMIKYDVEKDGQEIVTKVMVKLELNLPWKPVLAWPWGVTYEIDSETNLVTSHVESWDIKPWDGVLQIFRPPTVKITKK